MKEKKVKKGFRIDIVMPDGALLYVKTVKDLNNKARDVDYYRGQLHYGYAVRVTSKRTGHHMDLQCFQPRSPEREIQAAVCTEPHLTKRAMFDIGVRAKKGTKKKPVASVPPVTPKGPGVIESLINRFKVWLKNTASTIALEAQGFRDDAEGIYYQVKYALVKLLDKQARKEDVGPIALESLPPPVIDLPATEYLYSDDGVSPNPELEKESTPVIEGEHITGLPRVSWPMPANAGAREAGSLLH